MTKTFNKEDIISVEEGLIVVVDKDKIPTHWNTFKNDIKKSMRSTFYFLNPNRELYKCDDANCFKIIATIGTKRLKGVPMIELPDEAEIEALQWYKKRYYVDTIAEHHKEFPQVIGFQIGYKAAQAKGQYTEEDIKIAYEQGRMNNSVLTTDKDYLSYEDLIKSLQTKQIPTSIELALDCSLGGIKMEGASCGKNNNCKWPSCSTIKITNPETNTIIPVKVSYE